MRSDDRFSDAWQIWLGTFEALRRLGYPADDIYANCDDGNLFIMVNGHGGKDNQFQFRTGSIDERNLETEYRAACALWNATDADSTAAHKRIYTKWLHRVKGDAEFLAQLIRNEIVPPNMENPTGNAPNGVADRTGTTMSDPPIPSDPEQP